MIKIIGVGKIKEKFYREALLEYQKRLTKYTKLDIIEVPDYSTGNIELDKLKEKEQIEKFIKEKDYIITLEIEGKQYDSIEFSHLIEKINMTHSNITFVIGGSNGLHKELQKRSDLALSFSKFTFPHQLFRIILLEQIYRSFKIKNNENYHK